MNTRERTDQINTRQDLAIFVAEVAKQLRDRPEEWPNNDLNSFLEAFSAWIEDMDGYYQNRGEVMPEQPSWRTIGHMIAAALVYG